MKLFKNLSKLQIGIFSLLLCISGVLGYLFYDTYRTNIQNRHLIAESKIENKDLSQDLDIVKDKYDKLKTEVDKLKSKVKKVSYKKNFRKKSRLYSAGKNSKKKTYKRSKVSYKKLYYDLKRKCYSVNKSKNKKYSSNINYKKKYKKKYSNYSKSYRTPYTSKFTSREYKRR